MESKTAIEKIKVLLGIAKEQKFAEVKLKDGTIMRYEGDTPMVGMPVMVVTAEGELPAPDGKYEMEDGSLLDVQGGIVAAIEPKAAEAPAAAPAPAAGEKMVGEDSRPRPTKVVTTKETVFASQEEIDSIKAEFAKRFEALEASITESKKENEVLKTENIELKKQNEEVKELVKQISDEPSVKPLEPAKDKFNKVAWIKEQKKGFKSLYETMSK
jgi:regulator of replication initiation timing